MRIDGESTMSKKFPQVPRGSSKAKLAFAVTLLMPFLSVIPITAAASVISTNFVSRSAPAVYPDFLKVESGASSSGVAGVNGSAVWNDVLGSIGSQGVTGNSGESANIAWSTFTSELMWSQSGSGTRTVAQENASGDMMDGHIEGWGPANNQDISLTMSGLADDFSLYDVYLYVGDDAGGRHGSFSINGSAAATFTSQLFTGTFTEVTTPDQAGNYIVFSGISGDSFTIVGGGLDVPNRTGMRGIEVVGRRATVPEPGTLLLVAAGLAGVVGARRKKKA